MVSSGTRRISVGNQKIRKPKSEAQESTGSRGGAERAVSRGVGKGVWPGGSLRAGGNQRFPALILVLLRKPGESAEVNQRRKPENQGHKTRRICGFLRKPEESTEGPTGEPSGLGGWWHMVWWLSGLR